MRAPCPRWWLVVCALVILGGCATKPPIPADLPIMGSGGVSESVFVLYFQSINQGIEPDRLVRLFRTYQAECRIEGVNLAVALAQMLVETNFLRFTGTVAASQNNFAGLGTVDLQTPGHAFPDEATGIRAQVQHLKAYASTDDLRQPLVDPRFRFVKRGSAPMVSDLSGRWAADRRYGTKLLVHIAAIQSSL